MKHSIASWLHLCKFSWAFLTASTVVMLWCLGKHTYSTIFKDILRSSNSQCLNIFTFLVQQKCNKSGPKVPGIKHHFSHFPGTSHQCLGLCLTGIETRDFGWGSRRAEKRFGSSMCYFLQGLMSVGAFWWCFEFQCLKSSCQHIHINHVHWIHGFQWFVNLHADCNLN